MERFLKINNDKLFKWVVSSRRITKWKATARSREGPVQTCEVYSQWKVMTNSSQNMAFGKRREACQ